MQLDPSESGLPDCEPCCSDSPRSRCTPAPRRAAVVMAIYPCGGLGISIGHILQRARTRIMYYMLAGVAAVQEGSQSLVSHSEELMHFIPHFYFYPGLLFTASATKFISVLMGVNTRIAHPISTPLLVSGPTQPLFLLASIIPLFGPITFPLLCYCFCWNVEIMYEWLTCTRTSICSCKSPRVLSSDTTRLKSRCSFIALYIYSVIDFALFVDRTEHRLRTHPWSPDR